VIKAFVDEYRDQFGVEPICSVLQFAPSAYRRHAARQRDPSLNSPRGPRLPAAGWRMHAYSTSIFAHTHNLFLRISSSRRTTRFMERSAMRH
jgi:hypothetical protein